MNKSVLSFILFALFAIPLVSSAQTSKSVAGFKFGSTEDQVSLILKDLKSKGVCHDLSSGYDFFTKKPRMHCTADQISLRFLSVPFHRISLYFGSPNERLTDIEIKFGFPDSYTNSNFELLVKDIEKYTGKKIVRTIETDKVGNQTGIARVKGEDFNITLTNDHTFGLKINFWAD
jgi:hypothetical protein